MSSASINETSTTDNTQTASSPVFIESTVSSSTSTAVAPTLKQLRAEAAAAAAALSAAEKAMSNISISTPRTPKTQKPKATWNTPYAPRKPARMPDETVSHPSQPIVYALPPGYTAIMPEDNRHYTIEPHVHYSTARHVVEPRARYAAEPPMRYAEPSSRYAEPPSHYAAEPPARYAEPPVRYAEPPVRYAEPPMRYAEPPVRYAAEPPSRYTAPPVRYATGPPSGGGAGFSYASRVQHSADNTGYAAPQPSVPDNSCPHSLANYPTLKRQTSEHRALPAMPTAPPAPAPAPAPAPREHVPHREVAHKHPPNAYQKGLEQARKHTFDACKNLFTASVCEQINTDLACLKDGEKPYSKALWTKFNDPDGDIVIKIDGETHAYSRIKCLVNPYFQRELREYCSGLIPDGWIDFERWSDEKEEKRLRGECGFGLFIKRRR